jgi:hypothetical protein
MAGIARKIRDASDFESSMHRGTRFRPLPIRENTLLIGIHLVTSTPQWIRRLVRSRNLSGPHGLCLYVNVCSNVLGSCGL